MLGFVKNIINRGDDKKNGGFYLQLDEDGNRVEEKAPSQPTATAVTEKKETKEETAQAVTTESSSESKPPETKKSQKVSVKKAKAKTKTEKVEPVTATPPAPVKPSTPPEPEEKTFAPKYLTPTNTMSRRRPGQNMNAFLEMARQAKVPISK